MTLPPIRTIHLFAQERAALLELLGGLSPEEWTYSTACEGWSVHDVALHILGDDLGKLAGSRDGHSNPGFAEGLDVSTFSGLVAAIDRQNDQWVAAARRISPALTLELLDFTGRLLDKHFRTLDLHAVGVAVDWSGPEPAPVWMDLAREYTERWHHQQHIREAVSRPGLEEPKWMRPVFETFVRGLNRSLKDIVRPEGTTLVLVIDGPGGGSWYATRASDAWDLRETSESEIHATVSMPSGIAWRLFTRGIPEDAAREASMVSGDPELANAVFQTVSILAN